MPGSIEPPSNAELIGRFVAATRESHACSIGGEPGRANRAFRRGTAAIHEIRRRGEPAIDAFLELLQDEDLVIRAEAAMTALEFDPERAERVLDEIAAGPSSWPQFEAGIALKEWRGGTWRFR